MKVYLINGIDYIRALHEDQAAMFVDNHYEELSRSIIEVSPRSKVRYGDGHISLEELMEITDIKVASLPCLLYTMEGKNVA